MRYNAIVKKNCKSGGPRVSNKDRKGGFAVISVLVILLILTFLSAIIMDLALNAHSTTMEMIENKKLYNAAQSGAEWGVAMLVANRDDLDDDVKDGISGIVFNPDPDIPSDLNPIRATVNGGTYLDSTQPASSMFGTGITVRVDILDCNYDPPTNYHSLLPPVKLPDTGGGGGTPGGLSQIGSSGYLDPNRNISFGSGGGTMRYFVVRSKAQISGGREVAVETMVVVTE
jgi:hypothetical protein